MLKPEIIEKLEHIKQERRKPHPNHNLEKILKKIKERLNNDGKRKDELMKAINGKTSKTRYNNSLQGLTINDEEINKSLRKYTQNHNSPEDIIRQKSLGGYVEKQAKIQEQKIKKTDSLSKNNLYDLSIEDQEIITKGGIKELVKYLRSYSDIWKEKYLEQRNNRTPRQIQTVKKIEAESGNKVKCLVDKKFVELFSKVQGISYRGGAVLGERVIVDSHKTLEDGAFLRNETIHCAQQREMGGIGKRGFIKWIVISVIDLAKKQFLGENAGLDESADYATDNQITNYETYMNQFTEGYLKTRKPFAYKKYADPNFRKQEFERIRNEDYEKLKQKKEQLKKELKRPSNKDKKDLILQKIEDIKLQLEQMEIVLNKLKKDNEVRVVLIKPDVPNTKRDDAKFQVWTESEKNRKIRLSIERFIQKHGKVENNYKEGVELRLDFQSTLKDLIKMNDLNESQSKKLEKELKDKINKCGIEGLNELKIKYYGDLYDGNNNGPHLGLTDASKQTN